MLAKHGLIGKDTASGPLSLLFLNLSLSPGLGISDEANEKIQNLGSDYKNLKSKKGIFGLTRK